MATISAGSVVRLALPVLAYDLTGSAWWVSAVVVADSAPYLVLGLVGGALADRYDRRGLMIVSGIGTAALLASIPAAHAAGVLTVAQVVIVAGLARACLTITDAAHMGALPTLAGRDRLRRVQVAVYGSSTVAELSIPALAGAALLVVPVPALIVPCVAAHLVAALMIGRVGAPLSLPVGERDRGLILAGVGRALAWLAGHRIVRTGTVVALAQTAGQGLLISQLTPWADRHLGVSSGDWQLGALYSAWAVGGLVSVLGITRLVERYGEARCIILAGPVPVVGALACALAPGWPLALVAVACWGTGWALVVIPSITLRQSLTPTPILSRVATSARMLVTGAGYPVGALVGGAVATRADPRAALLTACGVLACFALLAWCSPLRTHDPA